MKTTYAKDIHLIKGGKANWENTREFRDKKTVIIKEFTDKYALTISNEKNWMNRLLLKIRLRIEIWRKIEELSSLKNLHYSRCDQG
jgi:hypothetical protein